MKHGFSWLCPTLAWPTCFQARIRFLVRPQLLTRA
jgi:hypothetical protein